MLPRPDWVLGFTSLATKRQQAASGIASETPVIIPDLIKPLKPSYVKITRDFVGYVNLSTPMIQDLYTRWGYSEGSLKDYFLNLPHIGAKDYEETCIYYDANPSSFKVCFTPKHRSYYWGPKKFISETNYCDRGEDCELVSNEPCNRGWIYPEDNRIPNKEWSKLFNTGVPNSLENLKEASNGPIHMYFTGPKIVAIWFKPVYINIQGILKTGYTRGLNDNNINYEKLVNISIPLVTENNILIGLYDIARPPQL